jgi:hypothetical protein
LLELRLPEFILVDDYNPVGLLISISTNEIFSDDYITGELTFFLRLKIFIMKVNHALEKYM